MANIVKSGLSQLMASAAPNVEQMMSSMGLSPEVIKAKVAEITKVLEVKLDSIDRELKTNNELVLTVNRKLNLIFENQDTLQVRLNMMEAANLDLTNLPPQDVQDPSK